MPGNFDAAINLAGWGCAKPEVGVGVFPRYPLPGEQLVIGPARWEMPVTRIDHP